MKIAFILPSLVNQGPVIVAHTIIKHLVGKVDQIDVYYFDDKTVLDFPCPVHRISMNEPICFDNYDIIHSHMYRPDKYVVKWRHKITKAKTVSTIHQDIYENLKFSYNCFVALVFEHLWLRNLQKFDSVAVISKKLLNNYINNLPQSTVVYNGVEVDFTANADAVIVDQINKLRQPGITVIGTYANINKGKGIDQLISLLIKRSDVALVIIGQGVEQNRLQAIVQNKGLLSRALFLPYLTAPYSYMSFVDIYAMPSRSEGFGLAMCEAALMRKPIVCSDIDVFHEIFDVNQAAFFQLEDIASLSNAVDKALNFTEATINDSYATINSNFSGGIMAQNYMQLYQNLLR